MQQEAIFGSVFVMVLLTLVVWLYMYARRIHFITSNDIKPQDLRSPAAFAARTPAAVSDPSDNLKNLFEVPVIFYALAVVLFATNQVDAVYVGAAWVFVVFRALHSAVHCTVNIVLLRFYLYLISSAAVWFLGVRAAFRYFG